MYDPVYHNVLASTDEDNNVTVNTYDPFGNVLSMTTGYGTLDAATTTSTWSNGLMTSATDPDLNTTDYTYNSQRQLTAQVTTDFTSTIVDNEAFTYDGAGNVASTTVGVGGPDPVTTLTTYDGNNELLSQTNPAGDTWSATFSPAGEMLTSTDGRGVETDDVFDAAGELTEETDDANQSMPEPNDESFDEAGNETTSTDADGNVTVRTYDPNNRLLTAITYDLDDMVLRSMTYTYDNDGNVLTETDGDDNETENIWDNENRLESTTKYDSHGLVVSGMAYTYDDVGNVLTETDADGTVTTNKYDHNERMVSTETRASNGTLIRALYTTYDGNGNVVTTTDGDLTKTVDTVNVWGEVTSQNVFDRFGVLISSMSSTFDLKGNETSSTDGDNNVTTDTVDGDGRVTGAVVKTSAGVVISSWSETLDGDGNATESIDGDNNVTTYTYDGSSNLLTEVVRDSLGNLISSQTNTYDRDNNLQTSTDGDNNVTTYTYDGNRLVSTVVRANGLSGPGTGPIISSEGEQYDENGNVTQSVDGDNNVITDTYDGDRLMSSVKTDQDGNVLDSMTYTYDQNDNVTTITDGDNNVTTYAYQGNELISTVVRANGTGGPGTGPIISSSGETYDKNGNVTQSVDGDNNVTVNIYDGDRRMSTVTTSPAGTVVYSMTYTYDLNGNVLTSTDGDRNVATYTYQGSELVSTVVRADGVGGPGSGPIVSSSGEEHDKDGNVTESVDGLGNVTTDTYDGNRLMSTVTTDIDDNVIDSTSYTYDLNGNVTTITDGDNNVTTYAYQGNELISTVVRANGTGGPGTGAIVSSSGATYDKNGNVTTSTDGDNNVTTNTYDGDRLMSTVKTDSLGNVISSMAYTYDRNGNTLTITDGDNNVTTNTYQGDELVSTVVRANGTGGAGTGPIVSSSGEQHDKDGNVTQSVDGVGNLITNTYDGDRLKSSVTTDLGGKVIDSMIYTYDKNGNVLTVTDGDRNVTTNTYQGNELISTVVRANGTGGPGTGAVVSRSGETYDTNGNVTTYTDGDNNVTTNTYDGNSNLLTRVARDSLGDIISSQTNTYDRDNNLLTSTDGNGNVTTNTYEGNRLVSTVVRANGTGGAGTGPIVSSSGETYDKNNNITTSTDGDNNVTTNTYDGDRLMSTVKTDPLGTVITSMAYTYDRNGNTLTITDGDNNVTTNTYQGDELVSTVVRANGSGGPGTGAIVNSSGATYDKNGNVTTSTDGVGNVTTNTYDGNRLMSTVTRDPANHVISSMAYTYDRNGNVLTTTDGDQNVTVNTYDGNGSVLTTKRYDAGGTLLDSSTNTYDLDGNVLTSTDALGNVTVNTYDGNRLVTKTVEFGTSAAATTSYTYDQNGNTASATDPDLNVTSMTYDANGSVLTTTTALGTTTTTYDTAGNLLSTTDTAGRTITRTYDGNRVETEVWRDASGTVTDTRSFTYDAASNVLTASNDAGTVTMTYSGNRLLTRTDPNGLTLTYTYNAAGNVLTCTDSQGGVTSYTYDGGQVATKTFTDGTNELRVDYTYDKDGNVLTETRFADLAGTVPAGGATYTYDGNRLVSIEQTNGSGAVVSNSSYSYNAGDQLTSKTETGVTTAFSYDATGQLTQDGATTHSYDANGNPNGAGTTIGPANELLSDANGTYTYDGVGNLASWTKPDGTVWTYTYNNANQRLSATETLSGGTVAQSVTYAYDVFGNRTKETITAGSTTTVQEFAYDGAGTLVGTQDGSGTMQTRYVSDVMGPNTWLAQVATGSSGTQWLLTDRQGSVQTVLDNSGSVSNQITYDAFGNITSATVPTALPSVGFQGGLYDAATGEVRFGARDYNPLTQRWDEQDPLGLGGGDTNLFRFVGNGPTDGTDPSGKSLIVKGKDALDQVLSLLKNDVGMNGAGSDPVYDDLGNGTFLVRPGVNFQKASLGNKDRGQAWAPQAEQSANSPHQLVRELFWAIGEGATHDLNVSLVDRNDGVKRDGIFYNSGNGKWLYGEKTLTESENPQLQAKINIAYGLANLDLFLSKLNDLGPGFQPSAAQLAAMAASVGNYQTWRPPVATYVHPVMSAMTPRDIEFSRKLREQQGQLEQQENGRAFVQRSISQANPLYQPDWQLLERVDQRYAQEEQERWWRLSPEEQYARTLIKQTAYFLATGPVGEYSLFMSAARREASLAAARHYYLNAAPSVAEARLYRLTAEYEAARFRVGPGLAPNAATDFVGGVRIGQSDLNGLHNAQNLTNGRLQGQNSTCGLNASLSVIDSVNPGRGALDVSLVRGQIRANGGGGLNQSEVMGFLGRNLPDAAVVPAYGINEAQIVDYVRRGEVIAAVDGNHWVRVTGTFQEGNATWVRVYDPARGNYEQLLTSFTTRMYQSGQPVGYHNVIISIRP
ncbi:MAG: hypothetical protein K8U57_35490 [Planctomycetes bacterium]|nr:hypothetical protein [Planctomycetota bacterium]